MAAFFQDDLTSGVSTDLASWTPDIGDSWTQLQVTGARFYQVISTGIRSSGNAGDSGYIYTADAASGYATANYEVQFTLVATVSSIVPVYVMARIADAENMYAVRLVPSTGTCQLYKKVSGTWTALGSLFDAPAANSVCKLIVNGTSISFEDDGVQAASATDSDIAGIGKAGVGMGGGAELVNSTDDVSATAVLKAFSVTDLGAGGAAVVKDIIGGYIPAAR